MSNTLKYKGYTAIIEYDAEDGILRGKIAGIKDKIVFYVENPATTKDEFHAALDDYLEYCASTGKEPNKPYSGSIALRTTPELHKEIEIKASAEGVSNNVWIVNAIKKALKTESSCNTLQCSQQIKEAFKEMEVRTRETPSKRTLEWATPYPMAQYPRNTQ